METLSQIKIDENGTLKAPPYPYVCSANRVTWVHGRNVEDRPITHEEWGLYKAWVGKCLTPEDAYQRWADELFYLELERLELGIIRRIGRSSWLSAPPEIRNIVMNMTYNMGLTRFSPTKWPSFWRAFVLHDWERCAMEMMYTNGVSREKLSDWYTDVDNPMDHYVGRGERLVAAMLSYAA